MTPRSAVVDVMGVIHLCVLYPFADGPSTPTLGIDVLYSEYHRRGYQTLFQEDLCWYDHWGIMLSDIKSRETPGTTEEKKSR